MACFGVQAFRELLFNIYEARKRRLDVHLLPAAIDPTINIDLRIQEKHDPRTTHEERLAVTLKAVFAPKAGHAMVPRLFTNRFYDHVNHTHEDVMDFLLQSVLTEEENCAPLLANVCRGMDAPKLECKQCTYHRGAASEAFNMLPIPVMRNDGSLSTSVQDAVHAYFEAEDVVVDWSCLNNACGLYNVPNCRPNKFHRISIHPQVLVLSLVRWRGVGTGLLHAVVPEQDITLQGVRYKLKSVVCHIGNTKRGHYTCRIHFPTLGGTWWYYNDTERRLATDADMRTSDREKSYVLMYEKCSVASPNASSPVRMRPEQESSSGLEPPSRAQPVIKEVCQFANRVAPVHGGSHDSDAEEIIMESPPHERGPLERGSSSLNTSGFSRSQACDINISTDLRTQTVPQSEHFSSQSSQMPKASSEHRRPRIVTGFGRERVEDVVAHTARLSKEEDQRARQRYEEGQRGRMRDWNDNDLDRSGGTAWHAGTR